MVLEETLSDAEIMRILEKYPELNKDERKNDFEHGTLILSAATVVERERVWKNSLYDVVNLKMPGDIR